MKNGSITVLSAAIVVMMVLLTGCIEVTDEEGEGPVEFWNSAYDYEAVVNTTGGEQGKVSTFSYTETIFRGGESVEYIIGGIYEGVLSTEIRGMEYDYGTGNYSTVTVGTIDCYVVHYNITSDIEDFPTWYSMRVFIKVDDDQDSTHYSVFDFWAKVECWDSDGEYYTWENPNSANSSSTMNDYIVVNGEIDSAGSMNQDVEKDIFTHLYTSFWGGFWLNYEKGFRDGRKTGIDIFGAVGLSTSTNKVEHTVGDHTFEAWEAITKLDANDDNAVNKAVIAISCPIPLLFQWRVTEGGSTDSFEYRLTSITFV